MLLPLLGQENLTTSEEVQDKGLSLLLIQRTLDPTLKKDISSQFSNTENDIYEVAFLKAVEKGVANEIPCLELDL